MRLRLESPLAAIWPCLAVLTLVLLAPDQARAGAKERVAALAPSAQVLVMDAAGKELVAQNANEPFVPASVAKIVTAWMAMEVLGRDHRFQTRFYLDGKRTLYVRGGGDPFLISEELALLAPQLVAAIGNKPLTGMVLDGSYYPAKLSIPGIEDSNRSYDALNSALAVNFNTIQAVRRGSKVQAGEKQTPITPVAVSEFRARGPNGRGRISLSQDPAVSMRYAGELLAAFVARAGARVTGKISAGAVPVGLVPIYIHRQSRSLAEVLAGMLRGSNNYVANQVFLEMGGQRSGAPVGLEKSLKVARELLVTRGLAEAIHLEEGSGLSHGNRFTPRGLAQLLHHFAPHAGLLESRKGASFKTGTLEGVRTLAGYLNTSRHGRVRFVISLKSNNGGLRFQLMRAIESEL